VIAKETRASESNHWYDFDGQPKYTVPSKKDGLPRATTLRDARTMNLVPSVTTVLNVAAKPALIQWLQRQVLMAALTLPRNPTETEDEYIERIMHDSKQEGKAAADKGTEIHEAIQGFYEGKGLGQYPVEVATTSAKIREKYGHQEWIAERSFAHDLGFGGKCDLHSKGIVLDIKTKEFSDPEEVVGYDEHLMQLAAYRVGLGMPDAVCANVFVSRTNSNLVVIKEWTQDELTKGFGMFHHLLQFWIIKNKYQPMRGKNAE